MLGSKTALSPFAVAITVHALRGQPRLSVGTSSDVTAYAMLDGVLSACERHSAGCAGSMSPPHTWRYDVREVLKSSTVSLMSGILRVDSRLLGSVDLPEPSKDMPGVFVHNIGDAYEEFVLNAVALRLECLRLRALVGSSEGVKSFPASLLLPDTVGVIRRTPLLVGSGLVVRHPADENIAVALPTPSTIEFLAHLCTQTAALMLPSSVKMILAGSVEEDVPSGLHFEPSIPVDMSSVKFACASVALALAAECPVTFPVVMLEPSTGPLAAMLRQKLVAELSAAANANLCFDSIGFVAATRSAYIQVPANFKLFVDRVVADVDKVVTLVMRSSSTKQAILFKPGMGTKSSNPLCDLCAIVPSATEGSVFFLWFEVRDRVKADFCKKLTIANNSEFMLAPVAERVKHSGVCIEGTIFVPVTRSSFRMMA